MFEARDGRTGARVAIKVLHGAGALHDRRFEREAELLAQLVHPAIVRSLAYGVTPDGARYRRYTIHPPPRSSSPA